MSFWDGTRWVPDVPATTTPSPRRGRRIFGAAAEAALITLLIFGLIAGSAMAAKGGNPGKPGGGGASKTTATLVVTPEPVEAYGNQYSVTGSGFKPSTPVNIVLSMPSCCAFFTVTADASGDIWFVHTTGASGTYQIDAHQRLNGRKLTMVGTTTFAVVEPTAP